MIETEIKILDINKKEIEEKLLKLNAKKILDDNVEAYYFDKDDELRKEGKVLRLRKIGEKTFLTFKKKIENKNLSQREEHETEVNNFENTKLILLNLGYNIREKVIKHRTSYQINETKFEIDQHLEKDSNIPCLMEIESNEKKIKKYIEILNINKDKISKLGFFGLRGYYNKKGTK